MATTRIKFAFHTLWIAAIGCLLAAGCGPREGDSGRAGAPGAAGGNLQGAVVLDGSSTVFPISEAVAEEFQKRHPGVRVTVGLSGTGGGFKKFANGEIDISGASRPIKTSEAEAAAKGKIEFIELPVAFDGMAVMVNPGNTWAESLTVAELKKIWEPGSGINNWSQIRAGFPNQPLKLYGAGTDSGTFDYFTDAIVGKEGASRSDFTASEDDNVLVQGITGDRGALGFFGYAYYAENKDRLKLVAIDNGQGPVLPSPETINNGTYQPLSRPIFIYVRREAAERPEVQEFVRFYLSPEGRELVRQVGYIPLPDRAYELALQRFENRKTGSVFQGGSQVGIKIEDLLAAEQGG